MSASNDRPCYPPTKDVSNWMSKLDVKLHDVPLNNLCIPGSHDSFAYYLDKSGPVSPDTASAIVSLAKALGAVAKGIIHSWGITQSLSTAEQLKAGIRFFDIRLATRPDSSSQLYVVHSLYGLNVETCLDELDQFLRAHPKEVVLLDFAYFASVEPSRHELFLTYLLEKFGSRMCPVMDCSLVTLSTLWDSGLQLIVFSQFPHGSDHGKYFQFWPRHFISSPWPNQTNCRNLLQILSSNLEGGRPSNMFYVSQGVLTPDAGFIMSHLAGNLKNALATPLAPKFCAWVAGRRTGWDDGHGVNICIMDYVEMGGYIDTVIELNNKLVDQMKL